MGVPGALEHPWLSSYRSRWARLPGEVNRLKIEELETMENFRQAVWDEIYDYRNQVRGLDLDLDIEGEEPTLSALPLPMSEPPPPCHRATT